MTAEQIHDAEFEAATFLVIDTWAQQALYDYSRRLRFAEWVDSGEGEECPF